MRAVRDWAELRILGKIWRSEALKGFWSEDVRFRAFLPHSG